MEKLKPVVAESVMLDHAIIRHNSHDIIQVLMTESGTHTESAVASLFGKRHFGETYISLCVFVNVYLLI